MESFSRILYFHGAAGRIAQFATLAAWAAGAALGWAPPNARAEPHPLDPLDAEEVRLASDLLLASGRVDNRSHLVRMHVWEPPKAAILEGQKPPRRASALIYQVDRRETFEAIIDLTALEVASYRRVTGAQPAYLPVDGSQARALLQADPRWRQALGRLGIERPEDVQLDLWGAGGLSGVTPDGPRIWMVVAWLKGQANNAYARPLGLTAKVDLTRGQVLEIVDSQAPRPPRVRDLDESGQRPQPALQPLVQAQPDGPSFTLEGHWVQWHNWRFHFGVHPREGLVLHQLSYLDQRSDRRRSIAYRLSVSEMAVPYGDPEAGWSFRCALDEGDFGLGFCTPHRPGVDVPTYATLLDAVYPLSDGSPWTTSGAVALYEQFPGVLWRHFTADPDGPGRDAAVAARQLVISQIATLGNYDYVFRWIFHQDGTLQQQTLMTGIVQAKAVAQTRVDQGDWPHATLVDEHVAAVHHQHFFCFRLDLDVDGQENNAWEVNIEPLADARRNPAGNAFRARTLQVERESQARRSLHMPSGRHWKITHASRRNAQGHPAGYVLAPQGNAFPLADPASSVRRRASFLNAHWWCTPYAAEELYAAGRFVNQSDGRDGLGAWSAQDRPLVATDLVWWYTLGVTHLPRPEEWPVMPVHSAGFSLKPWGFFDGNPAQ